MGVSFCRFHDIGMCKGTDMFHLAGGIIPIESRNDSSGTAFYLNDIFESSLLRLLCFGWTVCIFIEMEIHCNATCKHGEISLLVIDDTT